MNKMIKIRLIILLLTYPIVAFGQSDTIISRDQIIQTPIFIPLTDCDHGHLCCDVSCPCCPHFDQNRIDPIQHLGPDYSKTMYPKNDGLTYNQYVGETIAGYVIADGWRRDSINGGFNKEIYENPYSQELRFVKQVGKEKIAVRYQNGKLFNGFVQDTLTVRFTPSKIAGYFNGNPYYESKDLTVIFRANCVNGLLQGKGVLCGLVPQYGIYNNIPLSECNFENGEIVGVCKHWDLNSVEFQIYDGKIKSFDEEYDYFEFRKILELTEVTYVKGTSEHTKYIVFERNKKTGKIKPVERN